MIKILISLLYKRYYFFLNNNKYKNNFFKREILTKTYTLLRSNDTITMAVHISK